MPATPGPERLADLMDVLEDRLIDAYGGVHPLVLPALAEAKRRVDEMQPAARMLRALANTMAMTPKVRRTWRELAEQPS